MHSPETRKRAVIRPDCPFVLSQRRAVPSSWVYTGSPAIILVFTSGRRIIGIIFEPLRVTVLLTPGLHRENILNARTLHA
jgi:hypothetical protein